MGRFGTGQAIRRTEDQRFLTGRGEFTDDLNLPNQAHLYLLRSPYAHGTISAIDLSEAKEAEGVIAVLTGEDLAAAGIQPLPAFPLAPRPNGEPTPLMRQPALAVDRVRCVGQPVVAILAESVELAKNAAELIELDIDELDAVGTIQSAIAPSAPQIWADSPGNVLTTQSIGDKAGTDAAFDTAEQIVSLELINNRLAPTPIEPRGCLADFDGQRYTLHSASQGVHSQRASVAECLNVDAEQVRILTPDVGGGFGMKFHLQAEPLLALFLARQSGRPVKWIADRTESFLSDFHGRDHLTSAELGLGADGQFLGVRIKTWSNIGAYTSQFGAMIAAFGSPMCVGAYEIPTAYVETDIVVSNTTAVDAYRGAGRPEALYLVERLVDKAARESGIAPDELRRRNFIKPDAFPYQTSLGMVYDSGEYEQVLNAGLARANWDSRETRRAEAAQAGRLRGFGLAFYVEVCSMAGSEQPELRFEPDGTVTVCVGTQATGQGHETSFGQMVADVLGMDLADIRIVQGDSDAIAQGGGTGGSRSMAIGGSAIVISAQQMVEQGKQIAAEQLEAAAADIEFDAGAFRVAGTDLRINIQAVAKASFEMSTLPDSVNPGLAASAFFQPEGGTFPNGCHVCEVEIDPETGALEIQRYVVEDDVGTVINPLLLEGQIVGGIGQGIGQALLEEAVYDPESAQLQTATFMDYGMPRADNVPSVDFRYREVPSPRNVIGVKGAGEAGTIGAPPAVVNAVVDALGHLGVTHLDMPLTPLKIWQAIHSA